MDESRGKKGETERNWRGRQRETDNSEMEVCFLGRREQASEQKKVRDWGGEIEELLLGCQLQSRIQYDISSEVVTEVKHSFIWLTLSYEYSQ